MQKNTNPAKCIVLSYSTVTGGGGGGKGEPQGGG